MTIFSTDHTNYADYAHDAYDPYNPHYSHNAHKYVDNSSSSKLQIAANPLRLLTAYRRGESSFNVR